MAKFCVKEYVDGYYYYEVEITDDIITDLNKSLAEWILNFNPLTMDEAISIMNNDTNCPRYFETYIDKHENKLYLNSMIHEWMMDEVYYHEKYDTIGAVETNSYIEL